MVDFDRCRYASVLSGLLANEQLHPVRRDEILRRYFHLQPPATDKASARGHSQYTSLPAASLAMQQLLRDGVTTEEPWRRCFVSYVAHLLQQHDAVGDLPQQLAQSLAAGSRPSPHDNVPERGDSDGHCSVAIQTDSNELDEVTFSYIDCAARFLIPSPLFDGQMLHAARSTGNSAVAAATAVIVRKFRRRCRFAPARAADLYAQ